MMHVCVCVHAHVCVTDHARERVACVCVGASKMQVYMHSEISAMYPLRIHLLVMEPDST